MKISSRLLLALVPTVIGIMVLYAAWAVRQREALLLEQTEADARAFSSAVSVAFAHAFRDLQYQDAREILAEIDDEPGIYGIVFYDPDGNPTIRSETIRPGEVASPPTIQQALEAGSPLVLDREVGGERVQSVFRVVSGRDGTATGVLEVAQPLTFVQGDRVNTAGRFVLNTLTLLLALALVLTWLVRRYVGQPLRRFVVAIRDLGEGDLSQRLDEEPDGSELAEAAREFNRMVGRLAAAMDEAERETDERLALEKRMREREHLAALGTLAAGVAHQLGTPLSVIGGRADVLLQRDGHSEKDARSLEIIREQTNRISRIVRNLLQFARRPEPRMGPTEVGSVVTGAIELLEPDFKEAEIRVDRHLETPAWAEADPELLEEVVITLLENAFQAVTEPGAAPWVRIRVTKSTDEVVVEIRDGGPGISPEAADRLFEPFFTTRSGGTGLGLSVARGIVEQLGGRLSLENASSEDEDHTGPSADGVVSGRGVVVRIHLCAVAVDSSSPDPSFPGAEVG